MHYLVTGGAGFIGTNIVKQLLAQEHTVRVLDNFSAGGFSRFPERRQSRAEYIKGDIRDSQAVAQAMLGIDGVFHEAAVPRVPYSIEHPAETDTHNIGGTVAVLEAARDAGVRRVVFACSSSIYGSDDPTPLSEDTPKRPKSPYALQKLAGGEYCRLFAELYGLETVALCYFNIYGPYMDIEGAYALVIGKFVRQMKSGEPLTICDDGEYYRDFTHVSDCVRANILAMQSERAGKGDLINIGNSQPHSINELAAMFGGPTIHIPPRQGDPRYSRADITKAKELLGWEPSISLEQGIAMLKEEWGIIAPSAAQPNSPYEAE